MSDFDGPHWNYEPCKARIVRVVVADAEFPRYWAREYVGQEREAVEVTYGEDVFYLDNEDGSGYHKVFERGGGPDSGHRSLAIERVVEERT